MPDFSREQLHAFIIQAKAAAYVGQGPQSLSYRPASHDLQIHQPPFAYLDSYFGSADFLGQEIVYHSGRAVWGMNYFGRILKPELIAPAQAGQVIQDSLSKMYRQGRFLGGFENEMGDFTYTDQNDGDVSAFTGQEWITYQGQRAYELVYHGGLIRD